MRITIVYERSRVAMDVHPTDKVKKLKSILNNRLLVQTKDDKKVGKYLEMKFRGAALDDNWVLQDIAVISGSVLKCTLKTVQKPKLNIFIAYNGNYVSITDDINPIKVTIADVRSMISKTLGIPVSIFCLSYSNDEGKKMELYDNNTLYYYSIDIGATLRLDLWNGWNELITAAIAGHEQTVVQYLSWDRPVRQFQQKVCLYIAAFYGYVGLAYEMMKYGARANEPVGTYPTRKWCNESEHVETKRCPIHVCCMKGHLPVLRLFIRTSPLCFITKDEQDRTLLQIVLRNRHRSCFEYLVVRQWARKTGKNFSIPITMYCRMIQWCERAKARALLVYGTGKSTYTGVPRKNGALIGSGVLIDGFSDKPVSSIPFSELPKPAISNDQILPALAMTKRKLRNMRQRVPPSRQQSRQFYRSSTSSSASFAGKMRQMSITQYPQTANLLESSGNLKRRPSAMSKITAESSSLESPNLLQRRESRISFKKSGEGRASSSILKLLPPPSVKRSPVQSKSKTYQSIISLPPKTMESHIKPFFHWSDVNAERNPVEQTLARYQLYRGIEPREHAIKCLEMTSAFTEKTLLQQVHMASSLSKRGVTKRQKSLAIKSAC